ncbi:hypothetical protein ILUMI_09938 [Ignelater luminosus]|uniref:Swiss Army Knife protein DSP-PTPase phosphatase domain-containing protein n=1 Tax=Ignelater luminosus TaxID=2038154 RepID=A0A8K0D3B4_IGNLU|nr:hypothetical protein ILUMI_09938 [Ignelater luminosus]
MSNSYNEFYPPWNFSWIVENELAAMGWPQTRANLEYLANVGIKHLVTLSPEKIPPITGFTKLRWTKIDIEEFEAPTVNQIMEFIDVCKKCRMKHEVSTTYYANRN